MSRLVPAIVVALVVASVSGCTTDWIGKGKGKAPPPAAAPVATAPVYK
ncbi:ABC transporter [Mesorhizobium sp. BAC0120]|nr:ABC transporter [Mesorhizobium sp. BAC0120]MDW6025526.1 ABC transporter [Mesorhizobium sp. BAC0120]